MRGLDGNGVILKGYGVEGCVLLQGRGFLNEVIEFGPEDGGRLCASHFR